MVRSRLLGIGQIFLQILLLCKDVILDQICNFFTIALSADCMVVVELYYRASVLIFIAFLRIIEPARVFFSIHGKDPNCFDLLPCVKKNVNNFSRQYYINNETDFLII